MKNMLFPKRISSQLKGITGQTYFQHFVNECLHCIYHPVSGENDFGIDGYIELVINENVTGKLIAVQIKHGDSFFNTSTYGGYRYVGEKKHLNYYLNKQEPIFIVIMDDDFEKMNWVEFNIEKTMPLNETKWWIEIPPKNKLQTNFKKALFQAVDAVIDFEEEIEINWNINSLLKSSEHKILAISKTEILSNRFDCIENMITKLSASKEDLIKARTSLDIFFPEYNKDSREIFQIPEIMNWLKISIDIGIPWFYFLDYRVSNTGLNLLTHSYCRVVENVKEENAYLIQYNKLDLANFLEKNFMNMNLFMDKYDIDLETNKEITDGICDYYFGCV